ncbi:polysaccharide deacetylase family protein [Priestia megaterium]|uniref:polysaccharide deacetylase family protein n=1 Tax=Priestia megaterium TaxID=1404 RepID=UPI0030084182
MKLKTFVMYICILFLLVGCNQNKFNSQSQSETNEQISHQVQSIPTHDHVYSPSDIDTPGTPYILPIKGASPKLTPSAWQRMLQWRRDILAFPKRYPNDVFVNGPNKKMVALTFDDGPDHMITPKIIATLKKENIKGTFFFIGEKVQKYPEIVKSAYNNGNIIANHSFYHDVFSKKTETEINQDLEKNSEAIRQVIGKSPALLRPPFGKTDDKLVKVAQKDHYKIILWSIDTLDWSNREQSVIQQNVLDNVRNGDIILMHTDEYTIETAKAVPTIIDELKRRGFQIVDVATLLNTSSYK